MVGAMFREVEVTTTAVPLDAPPIHQLFVPFPNDIIIQPNFIRYENAMPIASGKFYSNFTTKKTTRHRFISWYVDGSSVTLQEESFDSDLRNNRIRLNFSAPIVQDGFSVFDDANGKYICLCAITVAKSIHRLCFPNPLLLSSTRDSIFTPFFSLSSTTFPMSSPHVHYVLTSLSNEVFLTCGNWLNASHLSLGCNDGNLLLVALSETVHSPFHPSESLCTSSTTSSSLLNNVFSSFYAKKSYFCPILAVNSLHFISHKKEQVLFFSIDAECNFKIWSNEAKCLIEKPLEHLFFSSNSSSSSKTLRKGKIKAYSSTTSDDFRVFLHVESIHEKHPIKLILLRGKLDSYGVSEFEEFREFLYRDSKGNGANSLVDFTIENDQLWVIWGKLQKEKETFHVVSHGDLMLTLTGPNLFQEQESALVALDQMLQEDQLKEINEENISEIENYFVDRLLLPGRFNLYSIQGTLQQLIEGYQIDTQVSSLISIRSNILERVRYSCYSRESPLLFWKSLLNKCTIFSYNENPVLGFVNCGISEFSGNPLVIRKTGIYLLYPIFFPTQLSNPLPYFPLSLLQFSVFTSFHSSRTQKLQTLLEIATKTLENQNFKSQKLIEELKSSLISENKRRESENEVKESENEGKIKEICKYLQEILHSKDYASIVYPFLLSQLMDVLDFDSQEQQSILNDLLLTITPSLINKNTDNSSNEDIKLWCEEMFSSKSARKMVLNSVFSVCSEYMNRALALCLFLFQLVEYSPTFLRLETIYSIKQFFLPKAIFLLRFWAVTKWLTTRTVLPISFIEDDDSRAIARLSSLDFQQEDEKGEIEERGRKWKRKKSILLSCGESVLDAFYKEKTSELEDLLTVNQHIQSLLRNTNQGREVLDNFHLSLYKQGILMSLVSNFIAKLWEPTQEELPSIVSFLRENGQYEILYPFLSSYFSDPIPQSSRISCSFSSFSFTSSSTSNSISDIHTLLLHTKRENRSIYNQLLGECLISKGRYCKSINTRFQLFRDAAKLFLSDRLNFNLPEETLEQKESKEELRQEEGFYMKGVMDLFKINDRFCEASIILTFARAALTHLRQCNKEQEQVLNVLYLNIFKYSLQEGLYDEAYRSIVSNNNIQAKEDCLRRFVNVLCDQGRIDLLCSYSWIGLFSQVDRILFYRCKDMNLLFSNRTKEQKQEQTPFHILYCVHRVRGNPIRAAKVMYSLSQCISSLLKEKTKRRERLTEERILFLLQEQFNALTIAINTLSTCAPDDQWFCFSEDTESEYIEDELFQNLKGEASIRNIKLLVKEKVLVAAHLTLCKVSKVPFNDLTNEEVVALLLDIGQLDEAIALVEHWELPYEKIILPLLDKCNLLDKFCFSSASSNAIPPLLLYDDVYGSLIDSTRSTKYLQIQAWKFLRILIERLDAKGKEFKYHILLATRLLELNVRMRLPLWLLDSFSQLERGEETRTTTRTTSRSSCPFASNASHPTALLMKFISSGLLIDACRFTSKLLLNFEKSTPIDKFSLPGSCTWIPINYFDQLLKECKGILESHETKYDKEQIELLKEVYDDLKERIKQYFQFILKVSRYRQIAKARNQGLEQTKDTDMLSHLKEMDDNF